MTELSHYAVLAILIVSFLILLVWLGDPPDKMKPGR